MFASFAARPAARVRAPAISRRLQSPFLLNELEITAAAAIDFVRLREEYTGPCCRLQNSAGNTADIGFLPDGTFNWTSARSFIPSGGLSIAVLFDQSGNGRDFFQSTYAAMPGVVRLSGVLNGQACMLLDGVDDCLQRISPASTPLVAGASQYTLHAVYRSTSASRTQVVMEQNHSAKVAGQRAAIIQVATTQGYNGESNDAHIFGAAAGVDYCTTIAVDNSVTPNVAGEVNATTAATTTGGRTTANLGAYGAFVGRKFDGTECWQGYLATQIWLASTASAALRASINRYQFNRYRTQSR